MFLNKTPNERPGQKEGGIVSWGKKRRGREMDVSSFLLLLTTLTVVCVCGPTTFTLLDKPFRKSTVFTFFCFCFIFVRKVERFDDKKTSELN